MNLYETFSNFQHAVDSVSSGLNEGSLQMLNGQSRAYNGLNNTSSFSTAVAKLIPSHASQRNTFNNGMMLGHRNDAQWKSLQNLHRNSNALGQIFDRNVCDLFKILLLFTEIYQASDKCNNNGKS